MIYRITEAVVLPVRLSAGPQAPGRRTVSDMERHLALAKETHGWLSWAVDNWFTNGYLGFAMDEPFTDAPHVMELACADDEAGCEAESNHAHTTFGCIKVDDYREAPAKAQQLADLLKAVQAVGKGAPLTIDAEKREMYSLPYYRANIKGVAAPTGWLPLNATYVDAVTKHVRPDRWYMFIRTEGVRQPTPYAVAVRGVQLVGIVMPMVIYGSAMSPVLPESAGALA